MGCNCRQIRRAIARWVPGGTHLVGLLPDLHPEKGSEAMKMRAPVAGQAFHLSTGNSYYADEHRMIHQVDVQDVSELRRVGCEVVAPEPMTIHTTLAPEPRHWADPVPEKVEAPHDPVAQEIMQGEEPIDQ